MLFQFFFQLCCSIPGNYSSLYRFDFILFYFVSSFYRQSWAKVIKHFSHSVAIIFLFSECGTTAALFGPFTPTTE